MVVGAVSLLLPYGGIHFYPKIRTLKFDQFRIEFYLFFIIWKWSLVFVKRTLDKMMRKGRELYHQIFSETQRLLREIEEVRGRIQKLTEENFDLYYNDLSKQLTNVKKNFFIKLKKKLTQVS